MTDHARFSITGTVTRTWVSDSGKYGELEITSSIDGKQRRTKARAFSAIAPQIRDLEMGQKVTITGEVEKNPLKDKQKNDVKVDGYVAWVHELTVREIKGAGNVRPAPSSRKEVSTPQTDGDDLPF